MSFKRNYHIGEVTKINLLTMLATNVANNNATFVQVKKTISCFQTTLMWQTTAGH
jgi:hypothetical protein